MTNYGMHRLRALSENYSYIRFSLETDDDVRKVTSYMERLGLKWRTNFTLKERPLRKGEAVYIYCVKILLRVLKVVY